MKYIYGLVDPRDRSIRYIGQTDNLTTRLQQHCLDKSNTPKVEWIRGLKVNNLHPEIISLASVPDGENAHHVEYRWIYFARKNDWELTNTTAMKTEEYYTLQGYFERLMVEMERPEGTPERQYSMEDVKQSLIKNAVLFLNQLPRLGNLKRLTNPVALPVTLSLSITFLFDAVVVSRADFSENASGKDIFFIFLAIIGSIASAIGFGMAYDEKKPDTDMAWLSSAVGLGFFVITLIFL